MKRTTGALSFKGGASLFQGLEGSMSCKRRLPGSGVAKGLSSKHVFINRKPRWRMKELIFPTFNYVTAQTDIFKDNLILLGVYHGNDTKSVTKEGKVGLLAGFKIPFAKKWNIATDHISGITPAAISIPA